MDLGLKYWRCIVIKDKKDKTVLPYIRGKPIGFFSIAKINSFFFTIPKKKKSIYEENINFTSLFLIYSLTSESS